MNNSFLHKFAHQVLFMSNMNTGIHKQLRQDAKHILAATGPQPCCKPIVGGNRHSYVRSGTMGAAKDPSLNLPSKAINSGEGG
jgi:hypothetical protein